MSYAIEFDEGSKVVTVKYTGTVSLDSRLNAVNDVCTSYSHLNPLRILIVVIDVDMQLSFEDQKSFGAQLAANKDLINAKVAVLHPKNKNPNLIVDTVAFINGYQLVQFDNKKEAESWLASA
tara:strand:- start:356 stop:721 length:366 start_codon:yes stop_codon:yes gene_type:complete